MSGVTLKINSLGHCYGVDVAIGTLIYIPTIDSIAEIIVDNGQTIWVKDINSVDMWEFGQDVALMDKQSLLCNGILEIID